MAHAGTAKTIIAGFVGAPVVQYSLRSMDFGATERVLACWALLGGGAAGIMAGNRLPVIGDVRSVELTVLFRR